MTDAKPLPRRGEVWIHYKGARVTILTIAQHVDSHHIFVVYHHDEQCWIRDLDEFMGMANIDGQPVKRFTLEDIPF